MTVYVLMIHYRDSDDSYIEGIYANRSDAEARGKRILRRQSASCDYTVIEEVVIGL